MVEFLNKNTGTKMFVDESRVQEYEMMGHRRVSSFIEVEYTEEVIEEEKPVKKKKSTRKKKVEE